MNQHQFNILITTIYNCTEAILIKQAGGYGSTDEAFDFLQKSFKSTMKKINQPKYQPSKFFKLCSLMKNWNWPIKKAK